MADQARAPAVGAQANPLSARRCKSTLGSGCQACRADARSAATNHPDRHLAKLLVAGHLTIYLTSNAQILVGSGGGPCANWRSFWTAETTQLLGTLATVYGRLVGPIGWHYALLVGAYYEYSKNVFAV